jgi:hypothetical protein
MKPITGSANIRLQSPSSNGAKILDERLFNYHLKAFIAGVRRGGVILSGDTAMPVTPEVPGSVDSLRKDKDHFRHQERERRKSSGG